MCPSDSIVSMVAEPDNLAFGPVLRCSATVFGVMLNEKSFFTIVGLMPI